MDTKTKTALGVIGGAIYLAVVKVVANKITSKKLENLKKSMEIDIQNGKWD